MVIVISQPGFICGLTEVRPSGILTRTATVDEPSQPCGTRKAMRKKLSADASFGLAVT